MEAGHEGHLPTVHDSPSAGKVASRCWSSVLAVAMAAVCCSLFLTAVSASAGRWVSVWPQRHLTSDIKEHPNDEEWYAGGPVAVKERGDAVRAAMRICDDTKDQGPKPCLKQVSDGLFPINNESLARYTIGNFTPEEGSVLGRLEDGENVLLGDVLFERLSPSNITVGNRTLALSSCNGVLSATCENYARSNTDYNTYLTLYPPNGGPVSEGWSEYTQLIYSLEQSQLNRVWFRCASTTFSWKKKLYANYGLTTFTRSANQVSEIWIKKQALCCGLGLCSFTNW